MSTALLAAAVKHLREQFTRQEVADVKPYGGQFSAAEVDAVSYNCPAMLVTVLGWQPVDGGDRLQGRHARRVRMAVFVATKHAGRTERMLACQGLAEKLCLVLRLWVPDCTGLADQLAPLADAPNAENLYGRAIDAKGQALWLVDWMQAVKPAVPLPVAPELGDLVRIDITDITRQGFAPPGALGTDKPPAVTEDVQFGPL